MKTLSVCVIAKNEERFLEKSLASIAPIADEIIFVDTGSTDNTVKIAKQFTDKVSHFKWIDDFATAYNYCCDKASKDYIFRWDADFFIKQASLKAIDELKKKNFNKANMVSFTWRNIDTRNNSAMGEVGRDLIYQTNLFHNCSPVHAHFCPLPGTIIRRYSSPNIIIEHHKHHSSKKYRYSQSYKIIKKALDINPDNAYLSFHYILALVYSQEFIEALRQIDKYLTTWPYSDPERTLVLIEKKVACLIQLNMLNEIEPLVQKYSLQYQGNPQFVLLEADCYAISKPKEALNKYQEYLSMDFKPKDTSGAYHFERFVDHPRKMLAELLKQT